MTFSDAKEEVWFSIGSNQGDSVRSIQKAVDRLITDILTDSRHSGLWRSKALYFEEQPDFFNAVVCGRTDRDPLFILDYIQNLEREFGRVRGGGPEKGPRPLDIDILLYGARIISLDRLIVPHPLMRERKFVLLPMLEIDSMVKDPVSGRLFVYFLRALPPQGIYPWKAVCYHSPYP